MTNKEKAIEMLGEEKDIKKAVITQRHVRQRDFDNGSNQMHSKAVEVVVGLLEKQEVLSEALRKLIERIDFNGGIGEYKGGPGFVMQAGREAIAKAKES